MGIWEISAYIRIMNCPLIQTFFVAFIPLLFAAFIASAQQERSLLFVLEATQLDKTHEAPIMRSLEKRLEGIYPRHLRKQDVMFRENRVFLTLYGEIDTATVTRILTMPSNMELLPVYREADLKKIWDTLSQEPKDSGKIVRYSNMLQLNVHFGMLSSTDTALVSKHIQQALHALDLPHAGVYFGPFPYQTNELLAYVLDEKAAILDDTDLLQCEVAINPHGIPELLFTFNKQAAERLEAYTASHIGTALAIVVNEKVLSAASIISAIPAGRMRLSGGFSLSEITDIQRAIGYPYPVSLKLVVIQCRNVK